MSCAGAIELLWSTGCGALPVVNAEKRVVGIVTDRDICVALGTRDRRPSELQVRNLIVPATWPVAGPTMKYTRR